MYIYKHIYIYTYIYIYIYIYIYVVIYICTFIYQKYVFIHIYVQMYTHTFICMHTHTYSTQDPTRGTLNLNPSNLQTHTKSNTSHHVETLAGREARASIQENLFRRNVERFRGGLVSKAHRLLSHSTIVPRVKQEGKYLWPPAYRAISNRIFHVLGLYWSSRESGEFWVQIKAIGQDDVGLNLGGTRGTGSRGSPRGAGTVAGTCSFRE